jgi:glycosyltransferase involved in cell wall biosynthesis
MKIIFLINSLGAGGAEKSTAELARYLMGQKYEICIICLKKREIGIESEVLAWGIRLIFLSANNFLGRVKELRKILEAERPDIVHSVLYESNLLIRINKIINPKLKIVQSLVNTPYSAARTNDSSLPYIKFIIAKYIDCFSARAVSSYYHAITSAVLNHYKPLYHIEEEKSSVIFRGRNFNPFLDQRGILRNKLGFKDSFIFLVVGRQEFQKAHLDILRALNEMRLKGQGLDPIKIIFLGKEGKMTKKMQGYVRSNFLERHIAFLGFRHDVDEILAASDVFLFPSYYEGLGGALIEALAAGCPVVCSDIPVLREVIGSKDGALYVKPGNWQSLADAMTQIYYDSEKREFLSRKSYGRYLEAFQLADVTKRMEEMYSHIIKGYGTKAV